MKWLKRIFCKHEYSLVTVFYGDMRNCGHGIEKCKKCGKTRVIK